MVVKITSKRQFAFPARVLGALDLGSGDRLVADYYVRAGLEALTLDRKITRLPNGRRL